MIAAGDNGTIYTSIDYGVTWISNSVPNLNWRSVASSADGNKLVAAASNGGIYAWQATPTPRLIVTPSGKNIAISWTVPSTNFVLQQSSDLSMSNWVALTNAPTLDLSNLQNQVIFPPTDSSGFYRLTTP